MKKGDFHIHPNIINNPKATDSFIAAAIEKGFDEICFTDHMPLSCDNAPDRIPKGKVREYCIAVKQKAYEYRDKISIKTGIEIDYHSKFLGEIEATLAEGDFDLILGSSHLHLKCFDIIFRNVSQTQFVHSQLENTLQAVYSRYFDVITHFDMYRWLFSLSERFPFRNSDKYNLYNHVELINDIFYAMQQRKVKLEINSSGMYKKFDDLGAHPEKAIVHLAKNFNLEYIYGSDAHSAKMVGACYEDLRKSGPYKFIFK